MVDGVPRLDDSCISYAVLYGPLNGLNPDLVYAAKCCHFARGNCQAANAILPAKGPGQNWQI